jgi:hypothetical protein
MLALAPVRPSPKEERGQMVDLAEAKLFEAVREGRPWAITSLLRRLGKDRGYTERAEVAFPWPLAGM